MSSLIRHGEIDIVPTGDDVIFTSQCDNERKLASLEVRPAILIEPVIQALRYHAPPNVSAAQVPR